MAVPTSKLRLLGEFGFANPDGQTCHVTTKKNRALLAILAMSKGGFLTREQLCGLLWGDRAEEQARSSLRQSLAVMRKELGASAICLKTEDDRVGLDRQVLSVDVLEFLSCASSDDLTILTCGAGLYQGELLSDVTLKEEAFEQWLSTERRHILDTAILVFERLSSYGESAARLTFAKKLVELDPLREASQRALMAAYHAVGEKGLALQQFEECKNLLAKEFAVSPAAETLQLRNSILSKQTDSARPPKSVDEVGGKTTERPSIAVLPFTNLSSNPDQQYFADGISEDIITALTRFKSLFIVSHNSTFRYRGDVDASEAGRALDAKFVVVGSVRRSGANLRITAQLCETKSVKQVWAETYNVPETDLFKIQDELVQTIVGTLVGRVADDSVYHARLKPPASLAAYELLLQANSLNWESPGAKVEVRRLLESAIRLDPEYATAYALLAAVGLREVADQAKITNEVLDSVLSHARKAVEIDPNDSTCQSILGRILIACRETELAAEHISRAMKLNPNNLFAMFNYGSLLIQVGKPDEAISWFTQASRTDPYFNPSWVHEKFALAYFTARSYDLAANQLARASKLRFHTLAIAAASLQKLGKSEAAKQALGRALQVRSDLSIEIMHALVPYSRPEDEGHLREALLAAGIPE